MKGQLDLPKQLSFVWDETHSMAFYDMQNFPWGFQRKHSNASCVRKSYSSRSRAHLEQYPLSEFRPKQMKAVCVNQVHYRPLWQSV